MADIVRKRAARWQGEEEHRLETRATDVTGRVGQVVSTCGTRIRGVLHQSIAKASPEYFKRAASNPATDSDEQIRAPHVLKNMDHPALNGRHGDLALKGRQHTSPGQSEAPPWEIRITDSKP